MTRTQQWQDPDRWRESPPAPQSRYAPRDARDDDRWPHRLDDDEADTDDDLPVVNPYAVIALVAALIAVFPVAIVFGLIAFGHPRGRVMAAIALLLGAAEAAAVVALVAALGIGVPTLDQAALDSPPVAAQSTAPLTTTVAATSSAATPSTAAPVSTPAPVAATEGRSCTSQQVGLIGADDDGATLLCLRKPSSGTPQWSGPYNIGTGVFDEGDTCDPGIARSGRSAEGHALVCEGSASSGTWNRWVE